MLADLPPLPVRRTDANGKSPQTQTDAVTKSQNRRFRSVTFCCQHGGEKPLAGEADRDCFAVGFKLNRAI
jgi:hypothetical protein